MDFGFKTDIGKLRRGNEDSVIVNAEDPYFAVVADGMGGHNAGEVASKMAIDVISQVLLSGKTKKRPDYEDILRDAYVEANARIYEYAKENSKLMGMGTTTVTALVHGGKLWVGNVGDSRAYIITKKEIRQISEDHSWVWQLVKKGEITEQQAKRHPKRNYITRAMGTDIAVPMDVFYERYNGGVVLLCSDGLTNHLENYEIKKIVDESATLQEAADKLTDAANERGGSDNITVALFKI